MATNLLGVFQPSSKYEGVRPIHIYLLRLLYILMFFVLGRETWTQILTHKGPWEPWQAVAWCVSDGLRHVGWLGQSYGSCWLLTLFGLRARCGVRQRKR
jgi:hypothetical protein